jgi:hypothetical protein
MGAVMKKLLIVLAFALSCVPAFAQVKTPSTGGGGGGGGTGGTVDQGTPAAAGSAWPFKVTFGGAVIDPRDVSDRVARALGKITFDGAQPVTQSGTWTIAFPTTASTNAIAVRCVNAAGTAFESCGGGGGGGTGLTDAELRATPVPVTDGAVAASLDILTSTVAGNTAPAPANVVQVGGINLDGGNLVAIPINDAAPLSGATAVVTRNIPSGTQAVSVAILPLPAGAATAAKQDTGNASLTILERTTADLGTNVFDKTVMVGAYNVDDLGSKVLYSTSSAPGAAIPGLVVRNIPSGTQPVSASSLPLPTGAATETSVAKTASAVQDVDDVPQSDRAMMMASWETTTGGTVRYLRSTNAAPDAADIGIVTRNIPTGTQTISAVSLPLPAGAATAVKQSDGSQATKIVDRANPSIWANVKDSVTSASVVDKALVVALSPNSNTVNQGGANVLAGAWPMLVTDGTNTAAVKAASTAAGATDPAMVVAVSPNNSVTVVQPTGSNLHIACDSGCGGATSFADNAAFTFGTTPIGNVGFVVDEVATNTVTENSAGAPRMTSSRIAYADLSKSASNTNSFKVDFGGTAQPMSSTQLPLALGSGGGLKIEGSGGPAVPVSGTVNANASQGLSTGTLSNAWPMKTTDGTNIAAVKAASTAAVAADPALVVAISPNNTVPSTRRN